MASGELQMMMLYGFGQLRMMLSALGSRVFGKGLGLGGAVCVRWCSAMARSY